jgi:hypothetical protein
VAMVCVATYYYTTFSGAVHYFIFSKNLESGGENHLYEILSEPEQNYTKNSCNVKSKMLYYKWVMKDAKIQTNQNKIE